MNLSNTYNKIAENYLKVRTKRSKNDRRKKTTMEFMSLLPKGGEVLDLGCGPGIETELFIKKGFKTTGLDFSEKMLELAKKRNPKATFHLLNIKNISKLEKSFDGIYAKASLLHIPKKEILDTLIKIRKKLTPRGYLYIAVKEIKKGQPEEEVTEENYLADSYQRFFSYFTLEEIVKLVEDSRLKIIRKRVTPEGIRDLNWIEIIAKNY